MIPLHPVSHANHKCPYCRLGLESLGWYIPGMRNLAELRCQQCGRGFYGDLETGQGLYTPLLLEKTTSQVHADYDVPWFADWLSESYNHRTSTSLNFAVRECRNITRPVVLLNCIDTLYGHSLLKLLNAQHYIDHRRDVDIIVMIQPFLEWLVPNGVAQVWIVDLPLQRGTEWNDWLAVDLRERIEQFPKVYLSLAFSHPHPDDYDIERFSRTAPFPLDEWGVRLDRPTATFIWRDDRLWSSTSDSASTAWGGLKRKFQRSANPLREQRRNVLLLADALRRTFPALDFAVAGLGDPGDLPAEILDLRCKEVTTSVEQGWCSRYSSSHLVVGVHGSNMLLPSAHAGGCVELLGSDRLDNFLQDILFRSGDTRDSFFRYRFVSDSTTPVVLAQLMSSMIAGYPKWVDLMGPESCQHEKAIPIREVKPHRAQKIEDMGVSP